MLGLIFVPFLWGGLLLVKNCWKMVGLVANLGKFHLSLPARYLPKRHFRRNPITIITTVATMIITIRVVSSIFSPINNSKRAHFKPMEKRNYG
jgi:hypothetical protein